MSVDLREVTHKYMQLNLLHRYSAQVCSVSCGVYRGQPPILDFLMENGECSQKEIADFLRVSPATVAVSIKRLQKSGLVEKKTDESDLRYNKIRLTEKGYDADKQARRIFNDRDKRMFKGFSDEEILTFSSYLDRMIENLTPDKDITVEEMIEFIHKKQEESDD